MLGPDDMVVGVSDEQIESVIRNIDSEMNSYKNNPMFDWVSIIIPGDYSVELRDVVAKKYLECGWCAVYHRTSKENGERAGLIQYVFLTKDTEKLWKSAYGDKYVSSYHKVA